MSGGSYDYAYFKLEELSGAIRTGNDRRRIAFSKLLMLCSKAAHDIEWVDSCDYAKGDEHKAIDAVLAFLKASPDVIAKAAAYDDLIKRLKEVTEQEATKP